MLLTVSGISAAPGGVDIIKDISFTLKEREHLAVTGVNGAGKSTLLGIVAGESRPERGSVTVQKGARIAYLRQEASIDSELSVYEEAAAAVGWLLEIEKKLRDLEERMRVEDDPALYSRYAELTHIYETHNGFAAPGRVRGMLAGLGFREEDFERRVSTLSGGERTRLLLSMVLLSGADIIILDEPTNHLDIEATLWLEGELRSRKGALIVATHDRYFLDRVADRILDIEGGRGTLYSGGYEAFSQRKEAARREKLRAYLLDEARVRREEEVIRTLRSFNREKSVRRAESREKALGRMERVERPFRVDTDMRLCFVPSRPSGRDVLFADGVSFGYEGGDRLLCKVDLTVRRGERIALIGPNGVGKTTFLKILSGLIIPDEGEVADGVGVRKGYFDQELMGLDADMAVFDEISNAYPFMSSAEIRTFLAGFLFRGDEVFKKVRDLSGGEKGRLALALLMLSGANLLLLDEPTNHLDIPSREVLEEALAGYEGTLVAVSHDRYFISKVATRIIELDGGRLIDYDGGYEYYLERKAAEAEAGRGMGAPRGGPLRGETSGGAGRRGEAPGGAGRRGEAPGGAILREEPNDYEQRLIKKRELQRIKNKVRRLEEAIALTEERIRDIDRQMELPEVAVDAERLCRLSQEREEQERALEEHYGAWELLAGYSEGEQSGDSEGEQSGGDRI